MKNESASASRQARVAAQADPPGAESTGAHAKDASRLATTAAEIHGAGKTAKAHIHLLVGPVGAGKSTLALQLARERRAVRLTLDEWMVALFRPDRPEEGVMPWYVERADRCVEQIWRVARDIAETGTEVILEVGLLRRQERERLYGKVCQAGLGLTLYVVDASRDVRRERVEARNRTQGLTFSMIVPAEIFELASDRWEPPQASECEGRDVRFVWTEVEGGPCDPAPSALAVAKG